MDAEIINPFLIATQNVFKTMLSTQINLGKPSVKTNNLTPGDVTGVTGFAGDKKGTFTLSFCGKSAAYIYKSMIGEDVSTINSDVVDAIGELTNIISGQVRAELEKTGIHLSATLRTVVVGQNVAISSVTVLPAIALPASFDDGGTTREFFIGFSFE
jgi:chemotaxis protein CheX